MHVPQLLRRFVFDEWGGTETVVWQTAKRLPALGVTTEILATAALSDCAYEQRHSLDIRRFGYHYPYLGLSRSGRIGLDKKGGNPLSPALERYLLGLPELDLIHCHAMQRVAGLARRVARRRGIPYIVSFHGGHFEVPAAEIESMRAPAGRALHYGRLLDPWLGTSQALAEADGLICVGHGEYLKTRAAYPDKPVLHLPNGVDPQAFKAAEAERFRAAYGIPPDLRLLLCVARLDPQKNQLALIELMRTLDRQDLGLVLIGPPTSGPYTAQLEAAIAELGPRAWLIPGLPPDSPLLADAYAAAEIFILPSLHEPFGIVVLEAWMQRKPVLVADVGGLRQLVDHGSNGLRFSSPRQLAEQARALLDDPACGHTLGEQGYRTALKNYSWDGITRRLVDFYDSVRENSHNPRHKRLTDAHAQAGAY